jgi:hypothetical protein
VVRVGGLGLRLPRGGGGGVLVGRWGGGGLRSQNDLGVYCKK